MAHTCEYGPTSRFAHPWPLSLAGEHALVAPYAGYPLETVAVTAALLKTRWKLSCLVVYAPIPSWRNTGIPECMSTHECMRSKYFSIFNIIKYIPRCHFIDIVPFLISVIISFMLVSGLYFMLFIVLHVIRIIIYMQFTRHDVTFSCFQHNVSQRTN